MATFLKLAPDHSPICATTVKSVTGTGREKGSVSGCRTAGQVRGQETFVNTVSREIDVLLNVTSF